MVKVKGNDIEVPVFRDSFDRRAVQVQNRIVATLKLLGVDRDNVEVEMEKNARLKAKALVAWYFEGRNLKYSYSLCGKFIENLYVVDRVLEIEVARLVNNEITLDDFQREFADEEGLDERLIDARRILGVSEDESDFEVISRNYKNLSRKFHPDMEGGDHEKFQMINVAHKLIRKELE